MKKSSPKIALFYDWLNQWGGAERVLLDILALYPQAHLYTLIYDPFKTPWLPKKLKITASFINRLPLANRNPIFYTPLYLPVLRQFDLSQYDIIIATTTTVGHYLKTKPQQLFICYFHNINRYLYLIPPRLLQPLLKIYQPIDKHFAQQPDCLLCSSKTVQQRIQKIYHRRAKIIYPGVDTNKFKPIRNSKFKILNYFLIVSRLVPHKNIDLAIRTCQSLNLPLKIAGAGRQEQYLKSIATKTTEFLGQIDNHQLIQLYQNCAALIHPQTEDFGLTPLEAQACGKPVIALATGGATETIISGQTGLFFHDPKSLQEILKHFDPFSFKPSLCRQNALKFSQKRFMLNFKKTINSLWQTHIS